MVMRSELEGGDVSDLTKVWWLFLVMGIASLVAGVILVTKPSHSLATLAVVLGIFLLLDGIIELVESFGHSVENRGLTAIIGILGIVVGVILIRHPTHAVSAIGLLIGIWLLAVGLVSLMRAIALGARSFLSIVIALLEVVVGIVIISDPHIGYATLAIIVGIWLIINGVGSIALGVSIRSVRSELAGGSRSARSGVIGERQ
jgi:uncharacterized membrane protein HdeD (DUF308 family)